MVAGYISEVPLKLFSNNYIVEVEERYSKTLQTFGDQWLYVCCIVIGKLKKGLYYPDLIKYTKKLKPPLSGRLPKKNKMQWQCAYRAMFLFMSSLEWLIYIAFWGTKAIHFKTFGSLFEDEEMPLKRMQNKVSSFPSAFIRPLARHYNQAYPRSVLRGV